MKRYLRITSIYLLLVLIIVINVHSDSSPVSVSLLSIEQPHPGGFVYVDMIIDQDSLLDYSDIDGLQLMFAYDSSKLTLWDIQSPLLSDSCNWNIVIKNYFSDDPPLKYFWIKATARDATSLPCFECFGPNVEAITFEFLVSDNIDSEGDSTSVDFIWLSCDDNRFWSNQNDTILIADSVYNSDSLNITDDSQSFPSKTGTNINCFNTPVKSDTTILRSINFYSTKIIFQATTGISESEENLPINYQLEQNYPNPFNPVTRIDFYLPIKTYWELEIINITGQQIRKYVGEDYGKVTICWNGENNEQISVTSGIYFYKITTENYSDSKKMILLK